VAKTMLTVTATTVKRSQRNRPTKRMVFLV
jgi:hypothetical protein